MLFYKEGGYLPKWPMANGYTGCMIGSHADVILADMIVKQDYDSKKLNTTEVMEALLKLANT